MTATPVAPGPEAVSSVQFAMQAEELLQRLELFRIADTLAELRDSRHPNDRLIAWYEGRRLWLAQQLGIQGGGAS